MINRKTAVSHITEACREEFTSNNGNLAGCWGPTDDLCCDYQWLITLSGHQSRNRIDWCPVLMLSSTLADLGYPQRGSELGIPGYWATLYLRLTLIILPYLLFILSFWLSICFWCRQWLYTSALLHIPAFCRSINIGALRGLILCSYLGHEECNTNCQTNYIALWRWAISETCSM